MPSDPRRFSPLATHNSYKLRPKEVRRQLAQLVFSQWLRGFSRDEIAEMEHISDEEVSAILRGHVDVLWRAMNKWKLAEVKCHALAMELRLLRIGKEAPPDRPIESLNPPEYWLKAYKWVGIDTVNQLRSVDAEMLFAHRGFPLGAVDWAVMKLDLMGLSHVLKRPKRERRIKRSRISAKPNW